MVKAKIEAITFSDGTEVPVADNGVTILVGPNNSGKSQTLRDIQGLSRDPANYQKRVVTKIQVQLDSTNFDEWVNHRFPEVIRNGSAIREVANWGQVTADHIHSQLNSTPGVLGMLTDAFILLADGQSRLSAGDSQPSIDTSVSFATHPVQKCYYDSPLEDQISIAAESAFGSKVITDRYAGPSVTMRIGKERPTISNPDGRPDQPYLQVLKALPKLEEQGDGVRSYVGLLLHIIAGDHDVMLIDEPEAFLHPPQARLLGREIASQSAGKQSFIATHSADFLQGIMSSNSPTTIVRITRSNLDDPVNHPAILSSEAVRTLWADPLLRHSNILDGLFHDAVVLCEADTDCRYYSAVMESIEDEDGRPAEGGSARRAPDLLFTHCGGKDRMPMVVNALGAARVPVIVVTDFDILRNRAKLKQLIEAKGSSFDHVETWWNTVSSHLNSKYAPLNKSSLRDALIAALDAIPGEQVDRDAANSLKSYLKPNDGWSQAKISGVASLGSGNPANSCRSLLDALAKIGILVVPVGELERFDTRAGGHGTAWVATVFENNYHKNPGHDATEFVRSILSAATVSSSSP